MNKNEVAIIIPVYNAEKYIEQCLLSILRQDYKDIIPIIIDNNSTDNSIAIAKNILERGNFKYKILKEENQGVSFARNKGIKESNSQYICFLDPDDFLTPNSISCRVKILQKTGLSLTYGKYTKFNASYKYKKEIIPPAHVDMKNVYYKNHIGNLTGLYDCSVLGKFYQEPIGHEDYDMWIRILKKSELGVGITDVNLGYYRITPKSLSSNKIKSSIWHFNILKKYNKSNLKCLRYFIIYFIHHFIGRYCIIHK